MSNFTTLNIQRDPSSTTDRVYYNMDFYNSETVDDNKNQPKATKHLSLIHI